MEIRNSILSNKYSYRKRSQVTAEVKIQGTTKTNKNVIEYIVTMNSLGNKDRYGDEFSFYKKILQYEQTPKCTII